MKTLYDTVQDLIYESSDDIVQGLIEFFYPIFDLGLIIYSNFAFDKYLRFNELIEMNSKLYGINKQLSKKFLDILMYKKTFKDLSKSDSEIIKDFINNMDNKDLFKTNIQKERDFLLKNNNNYLLKSYFFLNNHTIEDEIGKCNYLLRIL